MLSLKPECGELANYQSFDISGHQYLQKRSSELCVTKLTQMGSKPSDSQSFTMSGSIQTRAAHCTKLDV